MDRPKLAQVSEEMKEWSALLGAELASWPGVTSRKMFGMTAFYRRQTIFAALPQTKAFATPSSIAFKLGRKTPALLKLLQNDARIGEPWRDNARWITLELNGEKDLNDALLWLDRAYRSCLSKNNSKN